MTRTEALAQAYRLTAHRIRHHINSTVEGFAADWDDSEEIRHALEDVELRHLRAADRLQAAAAREQA